MRTVSRLEQTEAMLERSFVEVERSANVPYLIIGMSPVFSEDFSVDVRDENVRHAVGNFSRTERPAYANPTYSFDGLERGEQRFEYTVQFRRNGLLRASLQLTSPSQQVLRGNHPTLALTAFDINLRIFALRARGVYEATAITPPYLLGMMVRTAVPVVGSFRGDDRLEYHTEPLRAMDYRFPFMQVDDFSDVDRIVRPLCDQAYQMFGQEGSPNFDAQGVWVDPTRVR